MKFKNVYLSSLIVLLFGLVLLFTETDHFTAFTSETARLKHLNEEKPGFPNVTLEDSQGRVYPFSEFKGRYVFLTFMYTGCTDACPQLEMNMEKVYEQIPEAYLGKDIVFLSISFDPEKDDPQTLDQYKDMFHSDGMNWRMARIQDKAELQAVLDRFGVIVIPDGKGEYTHNTAFYLVDPNGVLNEVLKDNQTEEAARHVLSRLEKERGDKL